MSRPNMRGGAGVAPSRLYTIIERLEVNDPRANEPALKYYEVNDKDLDYLVWLVLKDLKYLRTRSMREFMGTDANAVKIQKRQELADKLASLREGA